MNELDNILSQDLYELKKLRQPLSNIEFVFYGAGSMGKMALNLSSQILFRPKFFIDQCLTGFVDDIPIYKIEDIDINDRKNLSVILCVVTSPVMPIVEFLNANGFADVRHFYDFTEISLSSYLGNGWCKFEISDTEKRQIQSVISALAHDETSIAHYYQFLWWRIRRKEVISRMFPVLSNKKYFDSPCMPKLTENERFVDAGAHFGCVIEHFLHVTKQKFEKIWAFEPDVENNIKLTTYVDNLKISKIEIFDLALSNNNYSTTFLNKLGYASKISNCGKQLVNCVQLDTIELNPTIVKYHLEGHELCALKGSILTIERHRPILMVLADHNSDGLYDIAIFLMSLKNYKLFFNLHDYGGNSAIFYAIPKERYFNG